MSPARCPPPRNKLKEGMSAFVSKLSIVWTLAAAQVRSMLTIREREVRDRIPPTPVLCSLS